MSITFLQMKNQRCDGVRKHTLINPLIHSCKYCFCF